MHKFLTNFNYIVFFFIFYNEMKTIFLNIIFFLYYFPQPNVTKKIFHIVSTNQFFYIYINTDNLFKYW